MHDTCMYTCIYIHWIYNVMYIPAHSATLIVTHTYMYMYNVHCIWTCNHCFYRPGPLQFPLSSMRVYCGPFTDRHWAGDNLHRPHNTLQLMVEVAAAMWRVLLRGWWVPLRPSRRRWWNLLSHYMGGWRINYYRLTKGSGREWGCLEVRPIEINPCVGRVLVHRARNGRSLLVGLQNPHNHSIQLL